MDANRSTGKDINILQLGMSVEIKYTNDKLLHTRYRELRRDINDKYYHVHVSLKDDWDESSYVCVATKENQVVGGCRLTIFDKHLLPMETKDFRISREHKIGEIAELSKLVVHPQFSKDNIANQLFMETEKMAINIGINYIYSIATSKQARLYSLYYKRYKHQTTGKSHFEILDGIQIPYSVKNKYQREVSSLIRVKIG